MSVHSLAPFFAPDWLPTANGTSTPNYGIAFTFNAGATRRTDARRWHGRHDRAGQTTEDSAAARPIKRTW